MFLVLVQFGIVNVLVLGPVIINRIVKLYIFIIVDSNYALQNRISFRNMISRFLLLQFSEGCWHKTIVHLPSTDLLKRTSSNFDELRRYWHQGHYLISGGKYPPDPSTLQNVILPDSNSSQEALRIEGLEKIERPLLPKYYGSKCLAIKTQIIRN